MSSPTLFSLPVDGKPIGSRCHDMGIFHIPDAGTHWEPAILEVNMEYMFSGTKFAFIDVGYLTTRIKSLFLS